MSRITPQNDYVLIEPGKHKQETVLLGLNPEKAYFGTVLAIGEGVENVKVGQCAHFLPTHETEVQDGDETVYLVKEEAIYAAA